MRTNRTYGNCILHFVFSTKHRQKSIQEIHRNDFNEKLRQICLELETHVIAVNNYLDHVHLLVNLNPKQSPAYFMKRVKGATSRWYNGLLGENQFSWARGYSYFSVNASNLPHLKSYILNNPEIHKARERRKREATKN